MGTQRLTLVAMVLVVSGMPSARPAAQPAQVPPRCLHSRSEDAAQRSRREQALTLAQAINRAENPARVVPGKPPSYKPLDQLSELPPAPEGFSVQLNTDGNTYSFSVKDTLDPCHYAIFSDQDRYLYEAIARNDVELRRLDTSR